jgi:hypothetical protein
LLPEEGEARKAEGGRGELEEDEKGEPEDGNGEDEVGRTGGSEEELALSCRFSPSDFRLSFIVR